MTERTLREKMAQAIYDELEGPIANQDFARQIRQWELSLLLADAAISVQTAPAVPDDVAIAGGGLLTIVEGITGAMKHGTWRDENGVRLKDTPEWVAFYNALNAANRAALSHPDKEPTA